MGISKLKSLTLRGFKSFNLDDHKIEFGDITVLIGANGAGKSNVVSFFKMVNFISTSALQEYVDKHGTSYSLLHYGPKRTPGLSAELEFESIEFWNSYEFMLGHVQGDRLSFSSESIRFKKSGSPKSAIRELGSGHRESVLPLAISDGLEYRAMLQILRQCAVFQFHDTSSESRIKNNGFVNDSQYLRSDAGNLAAFLFALKQNHEHSKHYERIVRHIKNVMPQFVDFVLRPMERNERYVSLDYMEQGVDYLFGPHQISDGSIRFMALAALLLQPKEKLPSVIVIDEPELGLHPAAISELAAMVKIASQNCQVVLATQSPTLLDEFDVNQIVVIERNQANKTSEFKTFSATLLEQWIKEYSLSEMWEKNIIGGQP